jgi:hypothetical protein
MFIICCTSISLSFYLSIESCFLFWSVFFAGWFRCNTSGTVLRTNQP